MSPTASSGDTSAPDIGLDADADGGADEQPSGSLLDEIAANPVVQTLLVMGIVSVATWTGVQAGNTDPFILSVPIGEPWWEVPLSVYSHATPSHLFGNALFVAIAGGLVSVRSSAIRFHIFFLGSGILAGCTHVLATASLGDAGSVLGASGAAFALVGYLITSNTVSTTVLQYASRRTIVGIVVVIALVLTIVSSGVQVANVTHFVGAMIGLVAGHVNLLRARS
jgi:membrane associated rhomboid family serine protease